MRFREENARWAFSPLNPNMIECTGRPLLLPCGRPSKMRGGSVPHRGEARCENMAGAKNDRKEPNQPTNKNQSSQILTDPELPAPSYG